MIKVNPDIKYAAYNAAKENKAGILPPGHSTAAISNDASLDKNVLAALINAFDQSAQVYVYDLNGSIVYVNQRFLDLIKYTRKEIIGRSHLILKSGQHPPEYFEKQSEVLSAGAIWRGELKNKAKDGTYYWVDATISPVLDSKGKIYRFVAVQFSITEKKEMAIVKQAMMNLLEDLEIEKEKLAEAKAKDEAMLAGIGDGVLAIDRDKKILMMNNAAKAMLNCGDREVVGKPYTDFFYAAFADGQVVPDSLLINEPIFKSGLTIKNDSFFYVPKNGGTKFPVALTLSSVKINDRFIGVIDVFRDITREKAVDKAKTEFVSLASHQLRTPLTSVSWYTEMLLDENLGKLSEKQKKYLEEVYKGNHRMVVLVNTLLNVSRLELGTFANRPELSDVAKLAQKITGEVKLQIDLKRLKFEERYGSGLEHLNIDPNMFGILLQNLLANAIKYTPDEGSISLELRLAKRGEQLAKQIVEKDSLVIIVADSGYGIPIKQQEKIYTKLFRADNVLSKDTDGTGLGLYMVKSIVEKSGGKTWFESEENKGSTFYISLPLAGGREINFGSAAIK